MGWLSNILTAIILFALLVSPIDLIPEGMINDPIAFSDDVAYGFLGIIFFIMGGISVVLPNEKARAEVTGMLVRDYMDERRLKRDPMYDLAKQKKEIEAERDIYKARKDLDELKGYKQEKTSHEKNYGPMSSGKVYNMDNLNDTARSVYGKDLSEERIKMLFGFRNKKDKIKKGGVKNGNKKIKKKN